MIIVPKEAPENMEKALREAVDLIGAQLNAIADKYDVMVSIVAYPDEKGDKSMYIAISDDVKLVSCFAHLTGEYANVEQKASVLERK